MKKAVLRSKPFGPRAERGGEIEAEAVDVADLDPVAQRIHHHLQHARMGEIERVAAAGEIVVEARIVRHQPVIGGVVDAAEGQRRAEMVALGGVVVDDVEHHLDAGVVQPRHRGAEGVERIVLRVARLRREEATACCSPSSWPASSRPARGRRRRRGSAAARCVVTPSRLQMLDHRRRRQAAEGAAQVRRHVLALLRQALDVGLVDDGVFPGDVGARSRRPQLKASSTTTAFGMPRALSRRSKERSSRALPVR